MTHVFISYSKQNRDYAWALRDQLLAEGFNVWIDEVIEPSTNWFDSIVEAIQTCAAFAVIMTPEARASKWVQREVALAEQLDKPVFPLLRAGDNWPMFVLTQYEPVTDGQLPRPQFYTTLAKHAPRSRTGTDITPPQPASPSPFMERGQGGEVIRSIDLLPPPFAWITIPRGRVTLITEDSWSGNYVPKGKRGKSFDVLAFDIAKYPVTNGHFSLFMESGGYERKLWWTDAGWQVKEKELWIQPRHWDDPTWNGSDYPVVGVSWYEVVAFCRWLSDLTGEHITLPSEQQWQRATQGDDNRMYPWGNHWDGSLCNNSVSPHKSASTSPVTHYDGLVDSQFGAVDMSGNVYEWCLNQYHTGSTAQEGTNIRILRGGAWSADLTEYFRTNYRRGSYPDLWSSDRGFRLARSH